MTHEAIRHEASRQASNARAHAERTEQYVNMILDGIARATVEFPEIENAESLAHVAEWIDVMCWAMGFKQAQRWQAATPDYLQRAWSDAIAIVREAYRAR